MHERKTCAATAVAVAIASALAITNKAVLPGKESRLLRHSDSKLTNSTGPSTS